MASPDIAKHIRQRDQTIPLSTGCQFPIFYDGAAGQCCGSYKEVVAHAILPPTWLITQHLKRDCLSEKAKLLRIIRELRTSPDRVDRYAETFFKIKVLQEILTDPKNYILLCPRHQHKIYHKLQMISMINGQMNWALFADLSLEFSLRGIKYWNTDYDPWLTQRAADNELLFQQNAKLKNSRQD